MGKTIGFFACATVVAASVWWASSQQTSQAVLAQIESDPSAEGPPGFGGPPSAEERASSGAAGSRERLHAESRRNGTAGQPQCRAPVRGLGECAWCKRRGYRSIRRRNRPRSSSREFKAGPAPPRSPSNPAGMGNPFAPDMSAAPDLNAAPDFNAAQQANAAPPRPAPRADLARSGFSREAASASPAPPGPQRVGSWPIRRGPRLAIEAGKLKAVWGLFEETPNNCSPTSSENRTLRPSRPATNSEIPSPRPGPNRRPTPRPRCGTRLCFARDPSRAPIPKRPSAIRLRRTLRSSPRKLRRLPKIRTTSTNPRRQS